MPGEDVEVAVELPHVHPQVGRRLGPVDQHGDPLPVRHLDHPLDRVDRPEGVGDVADGHELRPRAEEPGVLVEQQLARVVDGNDAQEGAPLLAQELPGDDVRVVLDGGDDDLVARPDPRAAVARGDQVDALGGAADEHDLARIGGVEEALDADARLLVGLGGLLAQEMHAPVHVRVLQRVVGDERVDHGLGLLARGRVVQVDEGFSVNPLVERRKVLPDPLDVPGGGGGRRGGPRVSGGDHRGSFAARASRSRAIRRLSSCARIGSTVIRLMTSVMNP